MDLNKEQIYSLLIDNCTDDLALMTVDGRVIYESAAVVEVFGYDPGDLINKNVLSLIHSADLPGILKLMAVSIGHPGKPYQFKYRFKSKTGEYVLVETSATFVAKDNFKGYMLDSRRSLGIDEINKKLINAEEKYRGLFNSLPDAFALHEVVLDSNGKPIDYVFLEVNEAFEKMTGLSKETVLGKRVTEVIPDTVKDPFDWIGKYGKLAVDGGGVMEFEQYSEALKRYYKGRAVGLKGGMFVVIFEDVTKQVTREAELERLKLAIDNVSSHVVMTDTDGLIKYANLAAEKITGYTRDEMMGTKAGKLWSFPMSKEFYQTLWKTIKEEKKSFVGEITNKRKTGEVYQAKVLISPIVQSSGELVGFVGIEDDISDQKKAKEELSERLKELEKLNMLMVGRELRMAEIKLENEKLKNKGNR